MPAAPQAESSRTAAAANPSSSPALVVPATDVRPTSITLARANARLEPTIAAQDLSRGMRSGNRMRNSRAVDRHVGPARSRRLARFAACGVLVIGLGAAGIFAGVPAKVSAQGQSRPHRASPALESRTTPGGGENDA